MKKSRAYGRDTRDKVLTIIMLDGINGISNKELSKRTGRDRNIISEICKDLEEDTLIRTITIGRRKTYFPSEKALDTVAFSDSTFLGREIRDYLIPSKSFGFEMHWYDLLDFHEKQLKYLKELFRNYELDPTFPFPFVKCNEDNIAIQELGTITVRLQNFIVKIGTIITYLLLHAGSSDLIKQISQSQHVTHKGSVDAFVQKWLQNVILSLHLLTEFKKIILGQDLHHSSDEKHKKSSYELDQELINKSLGVLKNLYPEILRRLEIVHSDLKSNMMKEKDQWKMVICDHEFVTKTSIGKQAIPQEYYDPFNLINYKYELRSDQGIKEYFCQKCGIKVIQNLESQISNKGLS